MNEVRDRLVAEAREWIGTPYRPYGRRKGKEADCIFHEEVGRIVVGYRKRHHGYPLVPYQRTLEKIADADLALVASAADGPIPIEAMAPGNLGLFYGRNKAEPQHFGMIAIHPSLPHVRTLIHASGGSRRGRVVEQSFSNAPQFLRALWKVYRFPQVLDG